MTISAIRPAVYSAAAIEVEVVTKRAVMGGGRLGGDGEGGGGVGASMMVVEHSRLSMLTARPSRAERLSTRTPMIGMSNGFNTAQCPSI